MNNTPLNYTEAELNNLTKVQLSDLAATLRPFIGSWTRKLSKEEMVSQVLRAQVRRADATDPEKLALRYLTRILNRMEDGEKNGMESRREWAENLITNGSQAMEYSSNHLNTICYGEICHQFFLNWNALEGEKGYPEAVSVARSLVNDLTDQMVRDHWAPNSTSQLSNATGAARRYAAYRFISDAQFFLNRDDVK